MQGFSFNPATSTDGSLSSNQPAVNFSGGADNRRSFRVAGDAGRLQFRGDAVLNNGAAQSLAYCLGYSVGGCSRSNAWPHSRGDQTR
jgi:hypothetical protein